MSFAYNNPKAPRLIVDLGDAHEVEGLFDTIADVVGKVSGAASSVNNAVAAGSKVVNAVGAQVQRVQRAVSPPRQAAPRRAPARSSAPAAPVRAMPAQYVRSLRSASTNEEETAPPAQSSSNALPIAIGAVALAAVGGGAWWFLGRKDGRRASHR